MHEKQPLRRSRRSGAAAILGRQRSRRPGFVFRPAADLYQRADYDANHIVEKTVGFDLDGDLIAIVSTNKNVGYRANTVQTRRAGVFETA